MCYFFPLLCSVAFFPITVTITNTAQTCDQPTPNLLPQAPIISCKVRTYVIVITTSVNLIILILAELPRIAREKRQPLHELMTPCMTQSGFGSAVSMAMTSSCLTVSFTKCLRRKRELMWLFDVNHITRIIIVENTHSFANNCT